MTDINLSSTENFDNLNSNYNIKDQLTPYEKPEKTHFRHNVFILRLSSEFLQPSSSY